MNRLTPRLFLLVILPLLVFLSLNKHSKDKSNSYHDVIWADAAGYYVYQPMWFIYGNKASEFPAEIEKNIGNGFYRDSVHNKVITKYPSGVAILQTPFFLISHALAEPLGFKADGFSKIYSFGLYFAGIFYCCFGLFLLSKFLVRHFSAFVSFIAPLFMLAGSNLYYYTIDAPGMSHIYSFFLFSVIVYLTPFIVSVPTFKYRLFFFSALTLAVLTRPTNILIGLFPLFYNVKNRNDFKSRINFLLGDKKTSIFSAIISGLFVIPQLVYWYSNTGNLISYSYGNERFIFWKSPKLLEVWFSTNNGLFLYAPLVALCIIGVILMTRNKEWEGYFISVIFLLISYIFSSWWNWWFGCSFGARSFVEYYALLIIPFCFLLNRYLSHKRYRYLVFLSIAFCCYLNMSIEYYYDGCFYGGTWDLASYLKLL